MNSTIGVGRRRYSLGGMIVSFGKVNRGAAYLQIPYLLWVVFAGYLHLSIALFNR